MDVGYFSIFENFGLISIVMPYYAHTHNAFLLLSTLYSGSRNKLNEYFDEFMYIMRLYSIGIIINRNEGFERLSLPSTLFQFKIELAGIEDIEIFTKFIENVIKKEGIYFNHHYMNKYVLVSSDTIFIEQDNVKAIEPYIKVLKSIRIAGNLTQNYYSDCYKPTLFDTISVYKEN